MRKQRISKPNLRTSSDRGTDRNSSPGREGVGGSFERGKMQRTGQESRRQLKPMELKGIAGSGSSGIGLAKESKTR